MSEVIEVITQSFQLLINFVQGEACIGLGLSFRLVIRDVKGKPVNWFTGQNRVTGYSIV